MSPRRQLLLERLVAGTFLRQHLLLIPASRQLLFERLGAGTFLGQRLLLILTGRQLLLERLGAGTFLRQQFLLVPASRQLLLERLGAGTFLGQQFLLVPAGRQLLLERLGAGTFLREVGSGPLGLFSDFRIQLWLPFSRLARRFLCLETGILGHLAFGGFLHSGSSLRLSHFACRLSPGLFIGHLPGLFPARRSDGCKLLLGSFPLRFLGQSFFLGGFPRG